MTKKELGKRIKIRLVELEMRQLELAKKLDVSESFISLVISGKKGLVEEKRKIIKRELGLELGD